MIKLPVSHIAIIATWLTLGVTSFTAALFSGVEPVRGDTRSLTGIVESVWEDGFRLRVDNRSIITDTWGVCGDFTARHVRVGDRLTVVGEYEGREFDVLQITNANGQKICR